MPINTSLEIVFFSNVFCYYVNKWAYKIRQKCVFLLLFYIDFSFILSTYSYHFEVMYLSKVSWHLHSSILYNSNILPLNSFKLITFFTLSDCSFDYWFKIIKLNTLIIHYLRCFIEINTCIFYQNIGTLCILY